MKKEQRKTGSESAESLRLLERGICIEIGEKPNRHWHYHKFYDLAEDSVSYAMRIFTEDSFITTSCSEEEFPLYFIKPKELRREKLERLKAINN